ncbi:NAD(P)/FAD-dependent oxidoreductase [Sinorhizobium meliloti]|uniref:NAD(P)/FAD-dependent oxidoreductase n=1 Tax=Rhizobium meliloti TaxID=382 RepID=UPI0003DDB05D|nr:FAD-dependent oxidoreductase [Sinorhizobium meliloti]ARS71032.1 D-nopaline dehydrogenase [Sinorhizobium meliloti RU11/001]
MNKEFDIAIVGGGIVGAAVGFGLAKAKRRVIIIDGADHALRASRTNGGLIWVQNKGANFPVYQRITRQSAELWPALAAELQKLTGIDTEYRRSGGMIFCLSDKELEAGTTKAKRMAAVHPDYSFEACDRLRFEKMLPDIRLGPKVCGGLFSSMDGHVNPLFMLRALLTGFGLSGGKLVTGTKVKSVTPLEGGYRLTTDEFTVSAERVLVAAGNDARDFAETLDLPLTLVPQRGQLMVTERVAPVFPYASSGLRQHVTGTFQLGVTHEDVGRSVDVTSSGANYVAKRVLEFMPDLAKLRVVRQWAGLRVLTPDGVPIFDTSRSYPGIHFIACHSGVTLAAFHAGPFADWLAGGARGNPYSEFTGSRFDTGLAS